ncbi:MAG: DUF6364 family protein [Candidatus Binatia bacterium]
MHTKLTLRLEAALIEKAKVWAKARRISLSQAVAEFFAQLPEKRGKGGLPHLSPWTHRLVGSGAGSRAVTLQDEEIRRGYLDYLEAKHR